MGHSDSDFFLHVLFSQIFDNLFEIPSFTNQATWCTYGPIVAPTEIYYNISYSQVNWFIYSFYITYSIFSFFVKHVFSLNLRFLFCRDHGFYTINSLLR